MQPTENNLTIAEKNPRRFARRVSAGDLSQRVRDRIAELMEFHECSDRAACAAQKEFPSFRITSKTVSDVMLLLIPRRPPVREISILQQRRLA